MLHLIYCIETLEQASSLYFQVEQKPKVPAQFQGLRSDILIPAAVVQVQNNSYCIYSTKEMM